MLIVRDLISQMFCHTYICAIYACGDKCVDWKCGDRHPTNLSLVTVCKQLGHTALCNKPKECRRKGKTCNKIHGDESPPQDLRRHTFEENRRFIVRLCSVLVVLYKLDEEAAWDMLDGICETAGGRLDLDEHDDFEEYLQELFVKFSLWYSDPDAAVRSCAWFSVRKYLDVDDAIIRSQTRLQDANGLAVEQ